MPFTHKAILRDIMTFLALIVYLGAWSFTDAKIREKVSWLILQETFRQALFTVNHYSFLQSLYFIPRPDRAEISRLLRTGSPSFGIWK
jgi:hypothetical protein